MLVDTLGLLRAVCALPANIQDRHGAKQALTRAAGACRRLRPVWADGGYFGRVLAWASRVLGRALGPVKRPDGAKGLVPLPRRWVVERTFAWFGRYRRLPKDHEFHPATSEAMPYIAMIHVMARRLA